MASAQDNDSDSGDGKERKGFKAFTPQDVQKRRLEKLMSNIDKPIEIPQSSRGKERRFADAPEFVRNVMGSSAGAGSGEFHVYRHLRRKEFARQRFIEEEARREKLDEQFNERLDQHKREAEERTAKKRAKRLKKKAKQKRRKEQGTSNQDKEQDTDEEESDEGAGDEQKEQNK